jgi:hypothetical protein
MTAPTGIDAKPRPSLVMGIIGLIAIFAGTGAWVYLGGQALHLHTFYASFVFAWYWGIVDKAQFSRLPSSLTGALLGIAAAWQLSYLSAHDATPGLAVAIGVIAVLLFMQIMHWGVFAVNPAMMLFLAVFTAPQLLGAVNYVDAMATTVAGALYMAGVIYVLMRVTGLGGTAKVSVEAA